MKEQNAVDWEGAHMLLKSSSFGNFVLPTRAILSHTLVGGDRGAIEGDIVTKHWFTHTFHWCRMVTFKRNTKTNPDLSLRGHPRTVAQDKGSSRGSFISTSVQVVTSLTCSIFVHIIMFKIEIYDTLFILKQTDFEICETITASLSLQSPIYVYFHDAKKVKVGSMWSNTRTEAGPDIRSCPFCSLFIFTITCCFIQSMALISFYRGPLP